MRGTPLDPDREDEHDEIVPAHYEVDQPYGLRDDERQHAGNDALAQPLRPRGPIMTILHGYRMAADRFAGLLGFISVTLVFPTVIISVVNVILREIGSRSGQNLTSNSLIEAQWYLYTLIFVFGFAYILRDGINVRVDFWFGNRSSRTQSWIDLVGHMIGLLPFAYIGIKYSWPSVELSWQNREQSPNAGGLPLYPIKTALLFAFVFIGIQGIAEVIKNIEYLRGHEFRHQSDELALAGDLEIDELAEKARSASSGTTLPGIAETGESVGAVGGTGRTDRLEATSDDEGGS
jgi:TRAP-type mannitol/chloroaromatic compound transport system permease small subunit